MTLELSNSASWMNNYLELVDRFNRNLIGLPVPTRPERLGAERKKWALVALNEELTEFKEAKTLENEVDAVIDLVYFALGRLIEMGVSPGPVFEEVHKANMGKVRGELSKRPFSKGYDAVKPDGWSAPNLLPYLAVSRDQVHEMFNKAFSEKRANTEAAEVQDALQTIWKPKLLILGHAQHGKDSVAEILKSHYGLEFESSSLFCAGKIIWPAVKDPEAAVEAFVLAGYPGTLTVKGLRQRLQEMSLKNYYSSKQCFEDRGNFRDVWFSLIATYCHPNKERLAREILAENDIYVGVRAKGEFHAINNSDLVDVVIWVDASDRLELEPTASCTVEQWMADYTIDNNSSVVQLELNVHQLMSALGFERTDK